MLIIKHLKKSYYDHSKKLSVFDDLNLEISEGEIIAIFGPNGCGKTTLFSIITGILEPEGGSILFNGRTVSSLRIGFVFQDYRNSLYPWLKVKDNISFPLKLKGFNQKERDEMVRKLCQRFGCNFDMDSYPYQLSGGQQQFVSFLRGLIIEPEIYLLDEPTASLDYQTTLQILEKLAKIWEETKTTTLFVSHEIDEAIFIAQRIVLLSNKPTRVLKIFKNTIPYPRKIPLIGSPEFASLKKQILDVYSREIVGVQLTT